MLCLIVMPLPAVPAVADMVRVPGGSFVMGRDDGPPDERPAHRLAVAPFEMDRLPATNAEFARFLDAIGPAGSPGERLFDADDPDARVHRVGAHWRADPGYENHPVVEVSWPGARAYCAWLGKRLPTEAEWEYAARGADGRLYPWGTGPPDPTRARFGAGWNATAPVGTAPAGVSPFGVHDLAGNVWQWVASAYRPYPYRADDGREAPLPVTMERVTRGGAHDSQASELTATHRGRHVSRGPTAGHHNIGFRCAR